MIQVCDLFFASLAAASSILGDNTLNSTGLLLLFPFSHSQHKDTSTHMQVPTADIIIAAGAAAHLLSLSLYFSLLRRRGNHSLDKRLETGY